MKKKVLGLVIIILAFVLLGWCPDARSDEQTKDMESFKKQAEEKLKALDKKLDELKAKGPEVKTDVKKEYEKTMTDLRKKQKVAKKKWTALKRASVKQWEKVKSETTAAIQDLEDSYEKAVSRFGERRE